MSTVLGSMAILSNVYAISKSYHLAGEVPVRFGAALAFTTLFALVGMVLGVISRTEKNKFFLFSYLGLGLNFIALAMVSAILYSGAYL